jgi:2-C-methyl-D-erythritol 4-phosphate cytidylyltransferase
MNSKILIHDAVRPYVSDELITKIINTLDKYEAVIPAVKVEDTLKIIDKENFVSDTVDREMYVRVQTPQGFRKNIINYYKHIIDDGVNFTDDSMVAEYFGERIKVINGEKQNIKITTLDDLKFISEL